MLKLESNRKLLVGVHLVILPSSEVKAGSLSLPPSFLAVASFQPQPAHPEGGGTTSSAGPQASAPQLPPQATQDPNSPELPGALKPWHHPVQREDLS